MVSAGCPRLVIAGTGSGVGKTSLALGLARELARRGLRVQTFKVGPDFLDPTYLAMASGRPCYNLDGWMTSCAYVRELFERTAADADIALVEGVMGLFDGASSTSLEGSTAEIARWLDTPVLLVVNAHGAARSVAATVKGFAEFEPGIRLAGVIANQCGTDRHRAVMAEALAAAGLPPLVGAVPRNSLPALPSRHLGLVTADKENLGPSILDRLADACAASIDFEQLAIGRADCKPASGVDAGGSVRPERNVRLGLARDAAFHFYYPDNLEVFERAGVQWVPFSPMSDARLPSDLHGLYFGGGYPELYAERLSENGSMLADVREFAASGRPVYGECGGMMYLGRSMTTLDGRRYPMAGIVPVETAMLQQLKTLGYTEISFATDSLWGPAGQICRGHEFHYSEIITEDGTSNGWHRAYTLQRRRGGAVADGFVKDNILASYVHLHWASRPQLVEQFVSRCEAHP